MRCLFTYQRTDFFLFVNMILSFIKVECTINRNNLPELIILAKEHVAVGVLNIARKLSFYSLG